MFKRFYRSLSTLTASTLMLGLLAFVPGTLAFDEFAFFPQPATKYVTGENPYEVTVHYVVQGAPRDIKFSIQKKGGNTNLIEEHTFYGNTNYTFKWDGKIGNNYVEAGEYELFIVEGFQNLLTHKFTVENGPVVNTPKLAFNNPPADIFNTSKQTKIDFQVRLTNFDQNRDINFRIQPFGQNAIPVQTIQYTESGTNVFSWDGDNMPPGEYEAIFSDDGLKTLTHSFHIVNAEPKLSFEKQPASQHLLADGEYKVSVKLDAFANDTTVNAAVVLSDSGIFIPQDEYVYKSNETHEFSWDVSDYEPGTYFAKISGVDSKNNITNELIFPFAIVDKLPTLAFDPTPAATYTVGTGEYKASVKLSNFASDTIVNAYIVDPVSKLEVSKDDAYTFKSNSTHEFTLDMKDYKPGDYEMRIYGEDKNKVKTNVLTYKFKVVDGQSSDPDSCAGYKDLKKTDWSCAAAEWAKAQGIITGQGGGDYFDGYAPMNRAEQAKIALMAHKKYNEATDYCKGAKPFSDINLGQWYSNYICLGKEIKMVTGYLAGPEAGQYMPNKTVTLPEMFCLLTRPLNVSMPQGASYNGLASNQWYSGCAKYVKDNGYFEADYMNPAQPATRFNALNFLYKLHQAGKL